MAATSASVSVVSPDSSRPGRRMLGLLQSLRSTSTMRRPTELPAAAPPREESPTREHCS